MIPVSLNWPREIKFESHLLANATFCRSIYPVLRGMDTVPTCSICMILPATVTKSMHIGRKSLKSFLLLQKCCEAYESKYQVPRVFSITGNSIIIITFATSPGVNGLESDLSSWVST